MSIETPEPYADVIIVAITGYGQEADIQRCKKAGIDYHFLKPVDPAELHKILAKAEELAAAPFVRASPL